MYDKNSSEIDEAGFTQLSFTNYQWSSGNSSSSSSR